MKPPARKVLLAAFVGVFAFALIEGGARVALRFLPAEEAPLQLGDEGEWDELMRELYRPDDELFFRLRPGLSIATTGNPRIFDVRTNALGLRGAEVSRTKPEGTTRVLCVGDSCTFGSGAGGADTWPAQMEQMLADGTSIEVLNAGVPGYSSYQGRRYLEIEGFELDPDVVVFTLGFNDSFQARSGPRRRFEEGVYLSDREYAEVARQTRSWGVVELWQRMRGPSRRSPTTVDPTRARKRRVSPKEYWDNVTAVARQCGERDILLVVVVWPVVDQTNPNATLGRHASLATYQDILRRIAAERAPLGMDLEPTNALSDVRVVDLVPLFEGRARMFIDDVHMNARGYRRVAKAVGLMIHGVEQGEGD